MSSIILTITAGILFGIILSAGYLGVTANKTINKPEVDVSDASTAYFAGGCFWCTEAAYEQLDGVLEVVSGFANGDVKNPTYDQVVSGTTGHKEAVVVYYNKSKISYEELVEHFWKNTDPTDSLGQFADKGSQYKTAIFYQKEQEKKIAEESKNRINASGKYDKSIVTEILPLTSFYQAEEYHQDYYLKNEAKYNSYKFFSGRTKYFKTLWGDEEMKTEENETQKNTTKNITKLQYDVTKNSATEKPFENEYWDNNAEGIYVDLFSGKPLFSSTDKYDSGTGWPSFTKPIDDSEIIEETDYNIGVARTEVRSKSGDAHLGHVFDDGPKEAGGKRYCMNSAALRFIPKEEMKSKGYEEYLYLFE